MPFLIKNTSKYRILARWASENLTAISCDNRYKSGGNLYKNGSFCALLPDTLVAVRKHLRATQLIPSAMEKEDRNQIRAPRRQNPSPDQGKSSLGFKPNQAQSSQIKPNQAQSSQIRLNQGRSSLIKVNQVIFFLSAKTKPSPIHQSIYPTQSLRLHD